MKYLLAVLLTTFVNIAWASYDEVDPKYRKIIENIDKILNEEGTVNIASDVNFLQCNVLITGNLYQQYNTVKTKQDSMIMLYNNALVQAIKNHGKVDNTSLTQLIAFTNTCNLDAYISHNTPLHPLAVEFALQCYELEEFFYDDPDKIRFVGCPTYHKPFFRFHYANDTNRTIFIQLVTK